MTQRDITELKRLLNDYQSLMFDNGTCGDMFPDHRCVSSCVSCIIEHLAEIPEHSIQRELPELLTSTIGKACNQ